MALFNFILRPTDEIAPWGSVDTPTLSWFGLTDGWYYLSLGEKELFRVQPPPESGPPYVDYQVVRLWEDVLDIVPYVLRPLPEDIVCHLRDPGRWLAAVDMMRSDRFAPDDDAFEQVVFGLAFWDDRSLGSGHLVKAPRLWLFRDGDTMNIVWRSHPEGAELWVPTDGELRLPVAEFLAELRDFDTRLFAEMGERVRRLREAGGRPGVTIDLDYLEWEQRDRATWLDTALARQSSSEDLAPARALLAEALRRGVL